MMHLLCTWSHTSRDGPGLLHWVQKARFHTMSGCSSVFRHSPFMAGLVFFVLVLVHQRTAALSCTHHPRLTATEQRCEDNSSVDFQLCGQRHIVVCDHSVAEASKSLACFTNPCRDFLVDLSIIWDHASKVLEALDSLRLCAIDGDSGLRGAGWKRTSVFKA